ncbi:thermonuclease family protein [Nitratireductor thuwali]|uniref:TNase-like domain-containing protein n=1 Tax=Nitratireductor thuwali TaxID=2267699 RepID=A0ABY5MM30_9HYPH|nr:hypothetical protein NTH_02819 [Nitratireductor thuwali]
MIGLASVAVLTCGALSAIDGDTISCDSQKMRITGPAALNRCGINTPETPSPKRPREKALGEQAKQRLEELLPEEVQAEVSCLRDRQGQPLAWVRMSNGETAGEVLRNGYAARWRPGHWVP